MKVKTKAVVKKTQFSRLERWIFNDFAFVACQSRFPHSTNCLSNKRALQIYIPRRAFGSFVCHFLLLPSLALASRINQRPALYVAHAIRSFPARLNHPIFFALECKRFVSLFSVFPFYARAAAKRDSKWNLRNGTVRTYHDNLPKPSGVHWHSLSFLSGLRRCHEFVNESRHCNSQKFRLVWRIAARGFYDRWNMTLVSSALQLYH